MSKIIDLSHLHKNAAQHAATPALDYERVKDFFYQKLEADRHGRGRMESAFFHTAQWIFQQGIARQAELLAEIESLQKCYDVVANNAADAHETIAELSRKMQKHDTLICSLLDPERFGWSVSSEVRQAAREALK